MAALVQTIPQPSGTVPVLPTRPSSSSGAFASPSTPSPGSRYQTMSWSSFSAGNSGSYGAGHPAVAPYPNLGHQHRQSWSPHMRPEHRTSSAPTVPQGSVNSAYVGVSPRNAHHLAAGSVSTSSSNSSFRSYASKDDSAIPSRQVRSDQPLRPLSTANIPSPPSFMNLSSPAGSAKPSPNRYRRPNQRVEGDAGPQPPAVDSPAQGAASISTIAVDDQMGAPVYSFPRTMRRPNGHHRVASADDSSRLERPQPELAKRYRRRSLGNFDSAAYPGLQRQQPTFSSAQSGAYDFTTFDAYRRPRSAHSQHESAGSIHSVHSSASSVSFLIADVTRK